MTLIDIILLAVALAMDCFTVSIVPRILVRNLAKERYRCHSATYRE